MTDTIINLQRKLGTATDLQSVVRTMKAMAASSITQYQKSSLALIDYYRIVELGLGACLRDVEARAVNLPQSKNSKQPESNIAIIFGSDQGLVGQFNDIVTEFSIKKLESEIIHPQVWTVGERVHSRLSERSLLIKGVFDVPSSVNGIVPLVGKILLECKDIDVNTTFYLIYNETKSGALYEPTCKRILPLDETWKSKLRNKAWPNTLLPEIWGVGVLEALIREYLFISLFRACAESLAAENASRLAAMQRANKNIEELLEELGHSFNHLRQSQIDEELFDLVSGFEVLSQK